MMYVSPRTKSGLHRKICHQKCAYFCMVTPMLFGFQLTSVADGKDTR